MRTLRVGMFQSLTGVAERVADTPEMRAAKNRSQEAENAWRRTDLP